MARYQRPSYMGGFSEASGSHDVLDRLPCLQLTGDVRLENYGGFIQAALDLTHSCETLDAECASPSVAMAKNTRFISARRIISGLGRPIGRISPRERTGRFSSFLSRGFVPHRLDALMGSDAAPLNWACRYRTCALCRSRSFGAYILKLGLVEQPE